ncbi:thiol:disulfide interchange protein DsbA/DsbL [Dyella sp. S184]|jgi:thiol:disulfide interchange protein DsbA|uniref:thiol:disulfide interchange protein DsbA/DsbL n=1 Tax=Dyella sp. S184 TaxID=1641862 RepID=UPI00131C988D|nr:thiol:disulfide interchange protein DsbA/DsbL [Dyella sp. S184]
MFKRFARPYLLTLLGGLLLASACSAQSGTPAPYTEGKEYVTLPGAPQRYSSTGKVEVVEVFSYACIHCAHFAPIAEKLRKELPAGAVFKLVPASFNNEWMPFARAYYAAKQLGVVDRTHQQLFDAKWGQNYPINSMDELADFYAGHGVNRADFLRIATSDETTAKLKDDFALIQKWDVDGTPSIVVDGKYKVANVQTLDEMAAVALWLAKRELNAQ